MLVILYLAEPGALERSRVERSWRNHIRSYLMKSLDVLRWWILRRYRVDFNAWQDFHFTNKGDAAIRKAVKDQIKSAFSGVKLEFEEVKWAALSVDHVHRLNEQGGLFVIGGSGYFHVGPGGNIPDRLSCDLKLISAMHCPRIAFGIGVNQFIEDGDFAAPQKVNNDAAAIIREILLSLDAISVRDQATVDILQPLASIPIHLTGDPALSLGGSTQARLKPLNDGKLAVGLNFALHGPEAAQTLPERMAWIVPVVRFLQKNWQCRLNYFVHSDAERIFPILLRREGINVEVIEGTIDRLIRSYGEMDFHLCQMLHSSILSIGNGIPTLNVAYDVKNMEFYRLLGVEQFCISPREATAELILERMETLRSSRAFFLAQVQNRRANLEESSKAFLRNMVTAAGTSGLASGGQKLP